MNYIYKNSVNQNLLFTLTEKCSLSSPIFLFSLTSHQSKNIFNFIAPDLSTATTRYNKFTIVETGTTYQNLTGGTIYLDSTGEYTYRIYEQSSPTNLIISAATSLVEVGLIKVSASTQVSFINDTTSITFRT